MKRILLFLLLGLSVVSYVWSQNFVPPDSLVVRFDRQLYEYPQEKVHLHTDKNHYVSGETIWFRGHLVDALTHRPDTASRYVYVELIDPADSLVARYMILHGDGTYAGHIPLAEGQPEGDYILRAYTRYMAQDGDDYFFHKPIRISDPLSATVRTKALFEPTDNDRRTNLSLTFHRLYEANKTLPAVLKLRFNGSDLPNIRPESDSITRISLRADPARTKNLLLIDYDKHRKYVEMPPAEDQFDVAFFPEGGYLIAGKSMLVGIKALKPSGQAEAVTGEIRDRDGHTVASFETIHKGIGTLRFLPEPGMTYTAYCINSAGHSKTFPLPEVREDAVALQVVRTRGLLSISAVAGSQVAGRDYTLVVQSRGLVQHLTALTDGKSVYIEPENLLSGVNHFILLDTRGQIVSERLVFVLNDDLSTLVFKTDRERYGRREPVRASFFLEDEDGEPLTGSFSVAVTDSKDIAADSAYTILTSLLMASELKGFIEDPGFYFQKDNPMAAEAAEGLMLTQGWRRYNLPQVLQGNICTPSIWPEKGVSVSGLSKNPITGRGTARTPVHLLSLQYDYFEETETDKNGRFAFPAMDIPDSTTLIVQAINRRGGNQVELTVDTAIYPAVRPIPLPSRAEHEWEKPRENSDYIAKAEQQWTLENGIRMIYIDEIRVTAQRISDKKPTVYHDPIADRSYSWEYFEEKRMNTFEDFFSQLVGVEMRGNNIYIRGGGASFGGPIPALIVVNGIAGSVSLSDLMFLDVSRIEILKGPEAAVFGSRGTGGVILINLKDGSELQGKPLPDPINLKKIMLLGFQEPAEFYSPKYETTVERNDRTRPDLRSTIYWNPDIRTDEMGEANFDFYAADAVTTYDVVIEGVTDDGRIVRAVETIRHE